MLLCYSPAIIRTKLTNCCTFVAEHGMVHGYAESALPQVTVVQFTSKFKNAQTVTM